MLSVGEKVIARIAAVPSRPPINRGTWYSVRSSSTTSAGVASTIASWAGVGGRTPLSSPAHDRHAVARIEAGECLGQPDGRAGQDRGHARVGVVRDRPADQLEDDDPTDATDDLRPAAGVDAAALDERAVDLADPGTLVEQGVEVLAAVLLLALDQEADPAGERPDRRQVGLDRPDPGHEFALVVGRATGVEATVADRRLVGRGRPQVERDGRLDVVVLDGVERPGSVTDLAHDERRHLGPVRQRDDIDARPEPAQPVGDPVGGAAQASRSPCSERNGRTRPARRSRPASGPRRIGRARRSRSSGQCPPSESTGAAGYPLRSGSRLGRSRKGSSTTVAADPAAAGLDRPLDREPRTGRLVAGRDRGQGDRLLEDRAPAEARHPADLAATADIVERQCGPRHNGRGRRWETLGVVQRHDVVPVSSSPTRRRAVRRPSCSAARARLPTNSRLAGVDQPAEPDLVRRVGLVGVHGVAGARVVDLEQDQAGLQPDDVEGDHPGRPDAVAACRLDQRVPHVDGSLGRDPQLVAEVAGVAGPAHVDRAARRPGGRPASEVAQVGERLPDGRLENGPADSGPWRASAAAGSR